MPKLSFVKAHGLGNDFLLVEDKDLDGISPAEAARSICDRHTGVGADGLVLLGPEKAGAIPFRILNADGTESELSGNAMRCAAAWLISRRESPKPDSELLLDTRAGRKRNVFRGRKGDAWMFTSEIAQPVFTPEKIPFVPPNPLPEPVLDYALPLGDDTLPITTLWMGNPQCVTFVDHFDAVNWLALGEAIEVHPYFPERVNVGFVRILARNRIAARFWERGVGHTLASGTGCCACAVAAAVNGKTGRRVAVETELGEMAVNWRKADGVVELTGPAKIVAQGAFFLVE
ncbi:MAG TPA: diaminopimelate epimerase [Candidatus Acidoferrales bacterium]|nr:diaminopimelate epimerase [Candidatus Acidoferrales bacterium]